MVTCPLAPGVPRLISGSCSSSRAFGLGFLQTPPRDDALAISFPSAPLIPGTRTLTSQAICHARHTRPRSRARFTASLSNALLALFLIVRS
jgi:hypothetical protein